MCGIVGIALPHPAMPSVELVRSMTDRIAHRGPDGDGVWISPGCGLGHRRLAIVDLSPAGAQPMALPDGTAAITFNGEVYDYTLVRAELEDLGEHFTSRSDTEVLLRGLRVWGTAALQRIHGMFAFAHWNASTRELLLARDRFGKKPLYYAPLGDSHGRDGLVFASELRSLLSHPRVFAERAIDPVSVGQYLLHEFVPQPRSILANVRKLGAGECLAWSERSGLVVTPYYSPRYGNRLRGDPRELATELTRRVQCAVARRLVADVPVGVFLSGGLDSSFVAACAVRSHPRVKTFAIGFDDPTYDESTHAARVAAHLGTDHHTEMLSSTAMLDLLPSTLDWMDEPHADSSILPTTLLARVARREVTVALGGDGGDEILAGYPTFIADRALAWLPSRAARRALGMALGLAASVSPVSTANFSTGFKLRQASYGVAARGGFRHAAWLAAIAPDAQDGILGPALADAHPGVHAMDAVRAATDGIPDDFDAATAFYLRVYLAEGVLQKVDRATMRASLEARAPLLDTGVVEYCLSLPPHERLRGKTTKWLMREALRPMVPASILDRPKKGFGAPVGQWLRGPLRELLQDTLSASRLRSTGWFRPESVQAMVNAHVAGRADHGKSLYALLVLEHWRSRWLSQG